MKKQAEKIHDEALKSLADIGVKGRKLNKFLNKCCSGQAWIANLYGYALSEGVVTADEINGIIKSGKPLEVWQIDSVQKSRKNAIDLKAFEEAMANTTPEERASIAEKLRQNYFNTTPYHQLPKEFQDEMAAQMAEELKRMTPEERSSMVSRIKQNHINSTPYRQLPKQLQDEVMAQMTKELESMTPDERAAMVNRISDSHSNLKKTIEGFKL